MSTVYLRKYGESATIPFELFEVDGINFRVDAVYAAGDVKIMKDEGAEANTTNSFTDEGTGYSIVLTATEMQAARIVLYFVDQTATKVWLDRTIVIETYGHASAQHAFDLDTASVAQTGDSYARLGAPAGASIAADLVVIDNFVDELESRLTAIRAGYLDELAAINIPADIDTLLTRLSAARAGYLDNLSAGAVALATELAKVPKSDGTATFNSTAVAGIQAGLATEAKQDIIDANLDAVLVDTGTTIPAQITALNDPTAAAIAAAVYTYNMGNSRTIGEALAFLRNKWTIAGSTLTVYDTDDTTVLWTATVATTAGDPVSSSDPA